MFLFLLVLPASVSILLDLNSTVCNDLENLSTHFRSQISFYCALMNEEI